MPIPAHRATAIAALLLAAASCQPGPPAAAEPRPGGKADAGKRDAMAAITEWNAGLSRTDHHDKYCKMAASAFAFYRGTNHLFWSDLAGDARVAEFGSERTRTWIQGDLHPYNFGGYDNDRGDIVYSLNDFDEAIIADYQYDVWHMAISLILIARENDTLSAKQVRHVVDAFSEAYLDAVASYRDNDAERRVVFTAANTRGELDNFLRNVARTNSRRRALTRWTAVDADGRRAFDYDLAKLERTSAARDAELTAGMTDYVGTLPAGAGFGPDYFHVKSTAVRLSAGIGSLGTPRFYVLVEGPSPAADDDRILDVKLQGAPTAYRFADATVRAAYDRAFENHARRHAIAQRALLKHADDHLGWMRLADGDYSVRERSVFKESFPTAKLDTESKMTALAEQWGEILAATHARADQDYDPELVPYSVDTQIDELTDHRHAEFRRLVRDIAFGYADRVATDYATFIAELAPACQ